MKITAAVMREKGGSFALEELELEAPRDNEVLVRMVATGVCHTDTLPRDQVVPAPFPAVYGHEGAGVVERVGSGVTKLQPGDHVVMSCGFCGHCDTCMTGNPMYCRHFFKANFGFARMDGSTKPCTTANVARPSRPCCASRRLRSRRSGCIERPPPRLILHAMAVDDLCPWLRAFAGSRALRSPQGAHSLQPPVAISGADFASQKVPSKVPSLLVDRHGPRWTAVETKNPASPIGMRGFGFLWTSVLGGAHISC